jgi:hypothetical protein
MDYKKHLPGFAPINFRLTCTIMLVSGLMVLIFYAINDSADIFGPQIEWLYVGGALLIVSLYIMHIAPKEE